MPTFKGYQIEFGTEITIREIVKVVEDFFVANPQEGVHYSRETIAFESVLFLPNAILAIDISDYSPCFAIYNNPKYD